METLKPGETGATPQTLELFKKRKFRKDGVEMEIDLSKGKRLRASLPRNSHGDPVLGPRLTEAISGLILDGCTQQAACQVAGLRYDVFEKWLSRGLDDWRTDDDTPHAAFAKEIYSALGDAEAELSKIVRVQCHNDPRLALETLARRNPAMWAPAAPEATDYKKLYQDMPLAKLREELARLSEGDKNNG